MEVKIAEVIGFCFGVERAIEIALKAIKEGEEVYTIGPLIHNIEVIKELEKKGIRIANSIEEIKGEKIIIRAHGVPPTFYEEAKKLEKKIYDGTCPYVKLVQNLAKKLFKEGYEVIIIGKKEHPEIKGVMGYIENKGIVISSPNEVKNLNIKNKRIGIVVQTTFREDIFKKIVNKILSKSFEIKIFNTRCPDTRLRQEKTLELAKESDLMIIVGGKDSSNTMRLFEISKKYSKFAYHIEKPEEIKREWFKGVKKVGIAGGSSTPKEIVLKVKEIIENIDKG